MHDFVWFERSIPNLPFIADSERNFFIHKYVNTYFWYFFNAFLSSHFLDRNCRNVSPVNFFRNFHSRPGRPWCRHFCPMYNNFHRTIRFPTCLSSPTVSNASCRCTTLFHYFPIDHTQTHFHCNDTNNDSNREKTLVFSFLLFFFLPFREDNNYNTREHRNINTMQKELKGLCFNSYPFISRNDAHLRRNRIIIEESTLHDRFYNIT